MKLVEKIEKDQSIKLSTKLINFLAPDYVFIPAVEELLVKYKDVVYKENMITTKYHSPISGFVVGTKECIVNNKKIKCLAIENDFKELIDKKAYSRKNINKLTKEEIKEILEKHNLKLNINKNILVINGLNESYVINESFILNEYMDIIIEIIDALVDIYKLKQIILCINETDGFNIINYSNIKGIIPEIKLEIIPNIYMLNYNDNILEYLNLDKDTSIISVSEIYDLYTVIKRNHKICETFITISGNAINSAFVINAKIGTSLKEIIKKHIELKYKDYEIIANSLLSGYNVKDDLIITKDIKGLIIKRKEDYQELKCIRCGKCRNVCPVNIDPVVIMDKKIKSKKCIDCGLCSYVCPSFINLRKYLMGDNNE